MDILPPSRKSRPTPSTTPVSPPVTQPQVTNALPQVESKYKEPLVLKRPFYRKWPSWVIAVLAFFVLTATSLIVWYNWALQPVDAKDTAPVRIIVTSGESSSEILDTLAREGLIRSKLAARFYVDTAGLKHQLQAGGYILSKNLNVQDIMKHIADGKTDELNVTILPGLTLKELADPEVKGSLADQGFTADEIKEAFTATYNSPLLVDRPQGQDLEGYVFPETYRMNAGDKLNSVIGRSFDELYQRLQKDGLIEKFKARGFNLHQAITLASIVQKEVGDSETQKQVAQVFYTRLATSMVLGSDVTFEYAASKLGVTPAVDIDSPYNTRKVAGLPPGPIANMNYSALLAVADPASGDYVYFVAGDGNDQGKTFFAHTFEQHEANIAAHCHDLCN